MKSCPTCHRPFERKGRWCFACDRPIKRKHKWHAEGIYNRHDDCGNPEMNEELETPLLLTSADSQADLPTDRPILSPEVPNETQKSDSAG